MSNLQESNNPGSPPDLSRLNIKYTRDSDYYFSDGSATFLVENVLFKFQASLLASKSSKVTFKTPTSKTTILLDLSNKSESKPGSSDEYPVKLPYTLALEFRYLLDALMARPGSTAHKHLFEDILDPKKHNPTLFWHIFTIGVMSVHFEIIDVARWAWPRVKTILLSVADKLVSISWKEYQLWRMFVYYDAIFEHEPDAADELLAVFRLTCSLCQSSGPYVAKGSTSELDAFIALYRLSSPLKSPLSNLALGCIFIMLLSLGHNSDVWRNKLTRDERSVFYTAQAHLVSLSTHSNLELGWLQNPRRFGVLDNTCSPECSEEISLAWSKTFGPLGVLNSPLPLEDVSKLASLPQYRHLFATRVRNLDWLLCQCQEGCGERAISVIDAHLSRIFNDQVVAIYKQLTA
ncbi:hypothetical protein FRC12_009578 [Ceratobasidium sp. 428]|nr:hypothetical protein FRC12_009578 [Ceratobasidium sp. 428]